MRLAAIAAAVGLLGQTAQAEPWTVLDLGRVHREAHCLQAAKLAFRNLTGEVRIARQHASDWVVYADGINGAHDALIA